MEKRKENESGSIWVIRDKGPVNISDVLDNTENRSGPAREFELSALGAYLLSPNPITIYDKLIGCMLIRKKMFRRTLQEEMLLARMQPQRYLFEGDIQRHFDGIYSHLRMYEPLLRTLSELDPAQVYDIVGICEDVSGSQYRLDLRGGIEQKIAYIANCLSTKVGVIKKQSYFGSGLFELEAFPFTKFNPSISYRMIQFMEFGVPKYKVFPFMGEPYYLQDHKLIGCLGFMEEIIKISPEFRENLIKSLSGDIEPSKLFFNGGNDIKYHKGNLPKAFKQARGIINSMNPDQLFNFFELLNSDKKVMTFSYFSKKESKFVTRVFMAKNSANIVEIGRQFPEIFEKIEVDDTQSIFLLDTVDTEVKENER